MQCPMHDERRHGIEHTGLSPKTTIGKTPPFHEPLIKVEDERIVKQGAPKALKETLRENKMDDRVAKEADTSPIVSVHKRIIETFFL